MKLDNPAETAKHELNELRNTKCNVRITLMIRQYLKRKKRKKEKF